jgi:hypothetical protein
MSELEDLRKIIGTSKVCKTRKRIREEVIITEYGEPSATIVGIAEALKNLPAPKHTIGDIVIVPPAVYGVVQFHLYEPTLWTWLYAIFLEDNSEKIHYFPEKSLVKRG